MRRPLKDATLIAESPLGSKEIVRFDNVLNLPNAALGEVSGIIHFEGSLRVIVVIGYTISWFDPFTTVGCHLMSGFSN